MNETNRTLSRLTRLSTGVIQRVKQLWNEGVWRGPFYGQGFLGNWFQLGRLEDGFQRDLRVDSYGMQQIPAVAGLRQLHRSAFAQLRPHHKTSSRDGTITDLDDSTPLRTMLRPNLYESGADFNARLADEWMTRGEVVVLGVRNERTMISAMHILPRSCWQLTVDPETRTVFYAINPSGSLAPGDIEMIVPARDVLHLRWATPRHPLMGESGFAAAGLAAGIHVSLSQSQAAFFAQMRRPSGVLSTDQQLSKEQMQKLRDAYDEQAKGMAQGGVPILSSGLKWQAMSISSEDAEVIAALRLSNEEIARCVGVPPPLIGDLEKSALTNTEAMIAHWLSISLGGLIERYERGLENLFELNGRTEWVDMSTEALLRVDLAGRMEALSKGVQGGVLTPNEARRHEGLSPIEGGDQAFLQRQNTPVNLLGQLAAADLANAQKAAAPSAAAPDGAQKESVADVIAKQIRRAKMTRAA
jgi:HK97 family phage portal protein